MEDNAIEINNELLDALNVYKKISTDLYGSVAQRQSEINYDKFIQAMQDAIIKVDDIYQALNKLSLDVPAELYKVELKNFAELLVKLKNLQEDMRIPYMLYVIGMGKAGKSSLLNSLVGKNVADVGTLPKTWKTDLFYKSNNNVLEDKPVKILYRDGKVELYNEDAAKELIIQEEEKREESEDILDREFKERSKLLTNIDEKKILRSELEEQILYRSSIREVRWALDNISEKSILNHFSLVDTPGLSQFHSGTQGEKGVRGEDIGDFYHQADGVLWLLDATTLSASTPKIVLENLEQSLSYANAGEKNIDNIVAVLNFADKVVERGGEEALEKVIENAKSIFGNKFIDFVPYSAKQAVSAINTNDLQLLEKSGFNKLCAITNQHFYFNAVDSRISSKKYGFLGEITTYQNEFFNPYLFRLEQDQLKFEERKEKAEKDLNNLIQQLENDWKNQFSKYEKTVNKNIDKLAHEIVELPESSHAEFMEKQIFRLKLLEGYQSKYWGSTLEKVSQTVERYRKYDAENFTRYKYIKNNDFKVLHIGNSLKSNNLSTKSISFTDQDATNLMIGGALAGVGLALLGPIGLLAGAFMMFGAKDRKINKAKESMRENLKNIKKSFEERNRQSLDEVKNKATKILDDSLIEAFTSLHTSPKNTEKIHHLFEQLNSVKTIKYQKSTFSNLLFE